MRWATLLLVLGLATACLAASAPAAQQETLQGDADCDGYVCSGHGYVDEDAQCHCEPMFSGSQCEVECSGHGSVLRAGKQAFCACDAGWGGALCAHEHHCATFAGSWASVDHLGAYSQASGGESFTVELWVRVNRGGVTLLDKHAPNMKLTNYAIVVGATEDDDTRVGMLNSETSCNTDWDAVPFTEASLPIGEWAHVAIVYDSCHVHFWINGEHDSEHELRLGHPNTGTMYIGRDLTGRWMDGALQELRMWSVPRSGELLRRNMHRVVSGNEAGLEGYWRMNEGQGNKLRDYTAHDNTATYLDKAWTAECAPIEYVEEADTCERRCNFHGTCANGVCMCDGGFTGRLCCKRVCEHGCEHGMCVHGECECEPGWEGETCAVRTCPADCSGNGECGDDGVCACFPSWTGVACDRVVPEACTRAANCSGHGVCAANLTCVCDDEYFGADCSVHVRRCPADCHGRGNCTDGTCVCALGYEGVSCERRTCLAGCNETHGACVNGTCVCAPGFWGDACDFVRCPGDCSGHGNCSRAGECTCFAGFHGANCSLTGVDEFVLWRADNGLFYWHLVNRYGDVLLMSRAYHSVDKARADVELVGFAASFDASFERMSAEQIYFFHVNKPHAARKDVLGYSRVYAHEASSERAIELVKHMASTAPLRESRVPLPANVDPTRPRTGLVVMGEVGQVELNNEPRVLHMQHRYTHPIVLALPASANSLRPAVVRVVQVDADDRLFTLALQAPRGEAEVHGTNETVSYVVLEQGLWRLPHGKLLDAGAVQTDAVHGAALAGDVAQRYERVAFRTDFAKRPITLTQVQTNNDPAFVSTRGSGHRATDHVDVTLEGEQADTHAHAAETVAYVAVEAHREVWSGVTFEAGHTTKSVAEAFTAHKYAQCFADDHVHFLGMVGSHHNKHVHLRTSLADSDLCGVGLRAEGDVDGRTLHAETVNYFAFSGAGLLEAFDASE